MKHYSDKTISACIANLLARLDDAYGEGMHWYGQTPDWYVAAAMVSCDIEDRADEATATIMAEALVNEAIHSST